MKLVQLIDGIGGTLSRAISEDVEISGLAFDSRRVRPGDLFFCVPGEKSDGHLFAEAALNAGASALVVERELEIDLPQVLVKDSRAAMAPIADRFNGSPSRDLAVAAITGTNGKTTTAWLLREILAAAAGPCGLIGTITKVIGGERLEAARTTPEAIELQADFRQMLSRGDRYCVIEASSHALQLKRCDSTLFRAAAFTNLTQDHLDFHADMEQYFEAKRLLFLQAPDVGVINLDDEYGRRLATEFGGIGFSVTGARGAGLVAERIEFDAGGARFLITGDAIGEAVEAKIGLPGLFNVSNALAAVGSAIQMGVEAEAAVVGLARSGPVPGRFEPVDRGQPFTVLVDYAHTPDSLTNVLRAARQLTEGRVISVFGAGGDRDRDKRPKMGRAGAESSDMVFVTSDNPRSEAPESIVAEVFAGAEGGAAEVRQIIDRREAIGTALAEAEDGDVVVIAGKGHEQGQEFADGYKIPFDDRQVAADLLDDLAATRRGQGASA